MIYEGTNLTRNKIKSCVPKDGDFFENCNFSQVLPHTKIFDGVNELTFTNCVMVNCDVPSDAVLNNTPIVHVSYCSRIHDWPELPVCEEQCEHVTDNDVLKVDGVLIDTYHYYSDKAVL